MHPNKAAGLDGYTIGFFQSQWNLVSFNLFAISHDAFAGIRSVKDLNHTFIFLIPKVENHINLTQFRPIRLCNVSYKILSKVIVNRIQPFLIHLISEEQTSFVQANCR